MRIAVNLLPFRKELGGVGRYAKNILRELSVIDKKNEYILFLTKSSASHFNFDTDNFTQVICNFNSNSFITRIIYEQLFFNKQLKKYSANILFTPSVAIPYFSNIKKITTVHDIAYKRIKKKYPFLRRNYISIVTKIAIKKSDLILTVSDFSKQELMEEFNIKSEKISVIYNGVGEEYFTEYSHKQNQMVLTKYKLPEKYILYVGAIEPGKNLDLLLESFYNISKINNKIFLVLTGGLGWKKEYIYDKIKSEKVLGKIIILPYISDEELPVIYRNAQLFIYISPYEGFGMPVLEAMASKVPVLASQNDAIKEFAKESIFYLLKNNSNYISNTILNLLVNSKEIENKIIQAYKKSEQFSWKESAKKIFHIINRAQ